MIFQTWMELGNCEAYSHYLEQKHVLEIMFENTFRAAQRIVGVFGCVYYAFDEWQFDTSLALLVSREAYWYPHSGKNRLLAFNHGSGGSQRG